MFHNGGDPYCLLENQKLTCRLNPKDVYPDHKVGYLLPTDRK